MAANSGNVYIDAMNGDSWIEYGEDAHITYYFSNEFETWTPTEKAAYTAALTTWTTFVNITIQEVFDPSEADFVETIATRDQYIAAGGADWQAARHGFPSEGHNNGYAKGYFSKIIAWTTAGLQPGGLAFETLVHELGHGLGLAHPHDGGPGEVFPGIDLLPGGGYDAGDSGDNGLNQTVYTVMSYVGSNPPPGEDPLHDDYGHMSGPMAFDIAAIQYMYRSVGDKAYHPNSDTYYLPDENLIGTYWTCIWDTGGYDQIVYNGTRNVTIDLTAATLDDTPTGGGVLSSANGIRGGFTIANKVVIEAAVGGSGNDKLTGNAADNVLTGNEGNDTLDGKAGADIMQGGGGSDTYFVDNGNDQVIEDIRPGTDTINTTVSYTLPFQVENLVMTFGLVGEGNELSNIITGNNSDNTLRGFGGGDILRGLGGQDYLNGGPGSDSLEGGADFDTAQYTTYTNYDAVPLVVDPLNPSASTGDAAGDTFSSIERIDGSGGDDTLRATHDGMTLNGLVGNDILQGGNGRDILNGSIGFDLLYGGAGQDDLDGGPNNDQLTGGAGLDVLNGGDGFDWARYDDFIPDLNAPLFIDLVGGDTTGDVKHNIEGLIGSAGWDIIGGDDGGNDLWGLAGDDNLVGRGGIDFLHGGAGKDALNGGADFDWVLYDDAPTGVVVRLDNPSLNTGDAAGDTFFFVEGVSGSAFGDTLVGNAGDNQLLAQSGADTVNGGLGNDTLSGGADFDFVDYSDASGGVVVDLGPTSAQNTVSAGVDTLDGFEGIIGSDFADVLLRGFALSVTLRGNLGDDVFHDHNFGDDTFDGGGGTDTIDYATSGVESVQVNLALSTARSVGGSVNTLIDIENIGGSEGDDVLTGDAKVNRIEGRGGHDMIDGGGGADIMLGQSGNDWYYVDNAGDRAVEAASGGNDRVLTAVSFALEPGSEIEVLKTTNDAGASAVNLTGNEFANVVYGNAGANVLDGAGGSDLMVGLSGNDWYYVDSAGDRAVEAAGGGSDRVLAAVSFGLEPGSEIETLKTSNDAGGGAVNLTGNAFANTLVGNAGANILDGAGGADTLLGLSGNDWYYVDNAGDQVADAAGQGTLDRVFAAVSYKLAAGAQIEILSTTNHTGTGSINLTGNEFVDTIIGNDGNNILDGKAAADFLQGRLGDDWYYVDNVGDQIVESAGQGTFDRVFASVSYALPSGAEIEALSTTDRNGTSPINLTGNALGDTISGNGGSNALVGLGGNDTLIGNAGADAFVFNTALGTGNVDHIVDFNFNAALGDQIVLHHGIFTTLAPGALPASAYRIGTAALDADDRIIYNPNTGELSYDADGLGGSAAVRFAILDNLPNLASTQFFVA